mmetsp:Transcript_20587/g.40436  ORF Transcript_20587/g.40436 Transcript_20587/m.40436 type:complete len:86 (+) Transcript_20587:1140-1397(+)
MFPALQTNQPTNQSINQPINQSTKQSQTNYLCPNLESTPLLSFSLPSSHLFKANEVIPHILILHYHQKQPGRLLPFALPGLLARV